MIFFSLLGCLAWLLRVVLLLLLLSLAFATSSFTFAFGSGENFNFRLRRSVSAFAPFDLPLGCFLALPDDFVAVFCFFPTDSLTFRFCSLPVDLLAVSVVVTVSGVNRFTFTTENAERRGVVGSIGLNGLLLGLKHSDFGGSDPVSGRTEGTRTIALDEKQLLGVVEKMGLKWFSSDRKLSPSSSSSSTA